MKKLCVFVMFLLSAQCHADKWDDALNLPSQSELIEMDKKADRYIQINHENDTWFGNLKILARSSATLAKKSIIANIVKTFTIGLGICTFKTLDTAYFGGRYWAGAVKLMNGFNYLSNGIMIASLLYMGYSLVSQKVSNHAADKQTDDEYSMLADQLLKSE
jgi:hypothetical protein